MPEEEWKKPVFHSVRDWLKVYFSGMCMGATDIVPGISGGAVAFILGIYQDFIRSIASFNGAAFRLLFRGEFRAFFSAVSWQFLVALFCGISTSIVILAKFFTFLLDHEVYRTWLYSVFCGLVLGATYFCFRKLSRFRLKEALLFVFGIVFAWNLSTGRLLPKSVEPLFDVPFHEEVVKVEAKGKLEGRRALNYDPLSHAIVGVPQSALGGMVSKNFLPKGSLIFSHENQEMISIDDAVLKGARNYLDFWVVACGAIAISCMLLPGISGSYMLTILGMYSILLGSLVDFLEALKVGSWDQAAFRIVLSMVIGILIGGLFFSRVVTFLLSRYRELTLATLLGGMIGALRVVWPFWSYQYTFIPLRLSDGPALEAVHPIFPDFFSRDFVVALFFFFLGFGYVCFIEFMAAKRRERTPKAS
jgi:putative membrane protein